MRRLSIALFPAKLPSGCAVGCSSYGTRVSCRQKHLRPLRSLYLSYCWPSRRAMRRRHHRRRTTLSLGCTKSVVPALNARARIGAHLPSLPLPRPRPAELAAVPPQAEAVSAKPNEQPESTSPVVADNTRTGAHPPAGPASPDAPNNVQAEPASPAAPNKAKPAVLIND